MDLDKFDHLDLKEWQRMRAWQLSQLGWKQRLIADALGVTEEAASKWFAKARNDGPAVLQSRPHAGPAAELGSDQLHLIRDFLGHATEG